MKLMKTIAGPFNRRQLKRPPTLLTLLLLIDCCLAAPRALTTVPPPEGRTRSRANPQANVEPELMEDEPEPSFEQTAANVSAFEGQRVYLPCRVHNLGDKVVSWMRSRDLHILTSGQYTFSSDERFQPQHLAGSDAWTLQLDQVKKSDAGRYECQVNTEPKMMYAVQLIVRDPNKPDGYDEPHSQQTRISYESTAPVAAIMGPREQRVPAGSTISLKCVITSPYQTRPIKGVQWFRDNRLLTFQAARGGINVETVTGTAQTFTEATLANLTWRDTGKYSCRPTEGKSDTIALYVEDGEHSEAMQRDAVYAASAAAVRSAELISLFTTFLNIFLCSSIRKLAVFC
ncbi:fibroblast growth factor receptor-like 1 isoform X3 [Nasonia vitripennis]|uniref:Ig-like domain-containing protein n=1 Tax=Nasonia vitripennis TaxID=7425 RepID=A0A7M7QV31_NASVI|nr:fibroblast growth factor receptor-like 1 isoform X3 [Nasonia vitripennis]XP_032455010.1 fibroblast growth factor receptor-like 1 isoform X3 [Nasonia vitripennis]